MGADRSAPTGKLGLDDRKICADNVTNPESIAASSMTCLIGESIEASAGMSIRKKFSQYP